MNANELLRLVDGDPRKNRGSPSGIRWLPAQKSDGTVVLFPAEAQQFLFRGQNRRYSPCYPSICRSFERVVPVVAGLEQGDRLRLMQRMTQAWWFCHALKQHPAMCWASEQKLFVDSMALAQHYGIPTGYIDLTHSPEVALFFATCTYKDETWIPVSQGEGVFYRVNWHVIPDRIKPIGLQPFPRPSEQWAWTLETCLGEDFELLPYLQAIRFTQDEAVGQEILSRFSGGADLFPPDVMADVAKRILRSNTLPESIARSVVADFAQDPQGLLDAESDHILQAMIDVLGVRFADCEDDLIGPEDKQNLRTDWDRKNGDFLQGVGVQLVRTKKPEVD
jgi:hypothetical protein